MVSYKIAAVPAATLLCSLQVSRYPWGVSVNSHKGGVKSYSLGARIAGAGILGYCAKPLSAVFLGMECERLDRWEDLSHSVAICALDLRRQTSSQDAFRAFRIGFELQHCKTHSGRQT